ncbi:MAG: tetraspanin family protein [Flavobacteriales bacterium]|jgi:Ca2+/Na+ antiporter|nr:tetraspanin family protein [Flavobacteriales bacterium]
MLEQIGVFSKKFMFPLMIIVTGIVLIIVGNTIDPTTNIKQTNDFQLGAYAILGAGVISLLYMLEVINKLVNVVALLTLFVLTAFFAYKSYQSVMQTIAERDAKKEWDDNTKQALSDVRDVQVAYKKKYGFYASDYKELKRFLQEDKVMDIVIDGDIPDRRITDEEGKILGYNKLKDEEKYNDIDEAEAVQLGIIEIDTLWYPIMEVMYTGEQAVKNNDDRLYPFELETLGKIVSVKSVDKLTKENGRAKKIAALNPPVYPMYTDTIREGEDLIAHFYAYDPVPYDPFVKRDTLSIGSKTEPKTNGSWADK